MVAQIQLRQSNLLARQYVRNFASGNDGVKGASQGGIIGSIGGNTTTVGQANEATVCGQVQTATYGNSVTGAGDGSVNCKSNEGKTQGTVTSQLHTTSTLAECGNIGTVESTAASQKTKIKSKGSSPSKDATCDRTASMSNMADDAVKQLQEAAANLPSKAQVEKFFFRVVAFIYDVTYLTVTWTIRMIDEKILQNATVKCYWKRFHEKMDQAKKD
ncbi:hypothetical protein KR093_001621 [Drosophila rubida]|uniref:Uncharacterized protein n=1 Tax=Drosophila rubida TaxID=30044 RepID=A0AAD4JYJ0_9MUSC|nr:hypothetical protein KR093_001621 [Drosophila rubida]